MWPGLLGPTNLAAQTIADRKQAMVGWKAVVHQLEAEWLCSKVQEAVIGYPVLAR